MARKKQETQELLAPDPFEEKARKGAEWFQKNLKLVIGGLVAVLGGILAVQFFQSQGQHDAAVVTTALGDAVEAYQEATDLRTVVTSTSPAMLQKGYRDAEQKLAAFREEHGKAPAARLGALYQADLLRRLGDNAEASKLYADYIQRAPKDDPLMFLALEGSGYAAEAQGKLDEAAADFQKIIDTQPFYSDFGLKHKARILEAKSDAAGALAAYEKIVAMDPASALKSFAEERVKALQ